MDKKIFKLNLSYENERGSFASNQLRAILAFNYIKVEKRMSNRKGRK